MFVYSSLDLEPHVTLNATSIMLLFVGCATAITASRAQGDTKDAGFGPFGAAEVQCMKEAEAVYVFSVQLDSSETPDQKNLRWLEPEARAALLRTLCNPDNWNFVTAGFPCDHRDIGVLFEKGKDRLILRFCSWPAPHTAFDVDGTFKLKSGGGWIKQQPWESWKQKFAHAEMR
jgi:hypothetical protein